MHGQSGRFNIFDFLRLVAASLVLYSHSYPLFGLAGPDFVERILPFTNGGEVGVWVFFIISGYLNTKSIRRSDLRVFLLNRALRIFPGLIVALLFSVLVLGATSTAFPERTYWTSPETWRYIYQNALLSPRYYLPGVFENNPVKGVVNGSLWTLPAEFGLYLCLPVVIKIFHFDLKGVTGVAAALFGLYLVSYSVNLSRVDTIVLGNALNVVKESFLFFFGSALSYGEVRVSPRRIIFLVAALLMLSRTDYGNIAALLIFPPLIVSLGLLDIRLLRLRNDISYGVYIYAYQFQQVAYQWLRRAGFPLMLFVAASLTFIVAAMSWRFIEKPILSRRKEIAEWFFGGAVLDLPDRRL